MDNYNLTQKIFICVFCLILAVSPLAQDIDLNANQNNKHGPTQLSIVAESMDGKTKKWQAYLGSNKISEKNLFELTGRFDNVSQVEDHRARGVTQTLAGIAMLSVAVLLFLDSRSDSRGSGGKTNKTKLAVSIGSVFLGLSLTGGGVDRLRTNWAPQSLAKEVADDYNQQLNVQIKGNL